MNKNISLRWMTDAPARRLHSCPTGVVFGVIVALGMLLYGPSAGAATPMPPREASGSVIAPRLDAPGVSPAAEWGQITLAGQSVYWIAKAPGNPDLLYAAVGGVGVYTSANGGQSWTALPSTGLTNLVMQTVTVCPSGAVFAGTWGGGVYRFEGSGWVQVNGGLSQLFIASLACDGAGSLLAGTYDNGVFRSTNGGGNWTSSNSGLSDQRTLVLMISDTGIVMAGTRDGAFISLSGGVNWAAAGLGGQLVYDFTFDPNDDQRIWAATGTGVFESDDRAGSWARVGPSGGVMYTATLDGNGELYAGAQGTGAYRWTGSQWVSETLSGSVYCMRNAGSGLGRLAAGTANGIWARDTELPTPTPTATVTPTPTLTATPTATATPVPGLALRLVSTPRGPVMADDVITYTVRYEVIGGMVLDNVVITNAVPLNTELITDSIRPPAPVGSFSGNVVQWDLGSIGPGESPGDAAYMVRVVSPLPTETPTVTPTATPTSTPETPPAPPSLPSASARRQAIPAAPLQDHIAVTNEGAWAYWDFGGERHETRSNAVIQGPLTYLPMILLRAGLSSP